SLGNGDDKKLLGLKKENLFVFEKIGKIKIQEKKIAFTHFPCLANELAKEENYDFIFYGHLHFPRERRKKETLLINPGNLAGVFFLPTFALWEIEKDKVSLEIL
ncbi:MAG: metallophosphoesterase family protein, partial [Minisyncoccales bacterium]